MEKENATVSVNRAAVWAAAAAFTAWAGSIVWAANFLASSLDKFSMERDAAQQREIEHVDAKLEAHLRASDSGYDRIRAAERAIAILQEKHQ